MSPQVDNAIFLKMPASSSKQIHDRRVNTILTDPTYLQYLTEHQNRNIDLTTTEPISKNSSSLIPSALPVTLLGVERTDNSGSDQVAPIIKFLCDKSSSFFVMSETPRLSFINSHAFIHSGRKQPQQKSKKDKRPSSSKRIPDSAPDNGAPKKIKSKKNKSKSAQSSSAPSEKFKVLQKEQGLNGPAVPTEASTNTKHINAKRSHKVFQASYLCIYVNSCFHEHFGFRKPSKLSHNLKDLSRAARL
jgi:hypothetical protein